jgi:hypothetical protein
MSTRDKWADKVLADDLEDPIVAGALKHFKTSVDSWSEAAYGRQRTAGLKTHFTWRLAASWALGCMLVAGALAGTLYERNARQESARIAAIKAAEQKNSLDSKVTEQPVAVSAKTDRPRIAVKKAASEDADLLASVDSDVSRQVPSAMEPLAQMMESSGSN